MEEETTGGQNRLFMILAVSLIGLLVLGLVGIGGVFIIRQNLEQQTLASQPTPTKVLVLPNATATPAPAVQNATNTPMPTPTNTPVVAAGSGGEEAAASKGSELTPTPKPWPTRTPVPGATEAGSTDVVPETGIGGLEAILIALGLTAVLLVTRRLRTA
jgi:cytoskeletal protein RodZ